VRESALGASVRLIIVGLLLALGASGCASYSEGTLAARTALDAGKPKDALKVYNEKLEVESEKELPKDIGGDNTLLILDRSMILQQLEQYALSSRDLEVADKQIEVLDFDRGALDDIGKYLFSDDSGPYRAPFYEKLLINTQNMLNYLEADDLNGARIEARRLAVMQAFISDHEGVGASLTGPGSYLAGFIFEKSGQPQEALRYYDEALQFGRFASLDPVIARLGEKASYRTPRITKVLDAMRGQAEPAVDEAELLVVVNYGRVPEKVPERLPIGLALTYASGIISPTDAAKANELAAQGLVTWINYPKLAKNRPASAARFFVAGRQEQLEVALEVDSEAQKAWDGARGTLVASAITRMITRIIAGETTKEVAGGGLVGTLLSLGTQATLTATDIPDTRSWSTLPARIAIGRVQLPPGAYNVEISASETTRRASIALEPGGWTVVSLTALR
jgi:tetratricopeptide (TPR) repeat protein